MEDVEEKETKRKERNAEEIARRKQGAETVTETETAATSGYPLSASSIVVITRKRKLRGSETVGKVVKVGWGRRGVTTEPERAIWPEPEQRPIEARG